jgi:hypothetical protein
MLLLLEIGLGILTFILKDKGWIKNQATYGLRNFILHYREDVSHIFLKMVHHSSSSSKHFNFFFPFFPSAGSAKFNRLHSATMGVLWN